MISGEIVWNRIEQCFFFKSAGKDRDEMVDRERQHTNRPTKDRPEPTMKTKNCPCISKGKPLYFLAHQRTWWGRTKLNCNLPSVAASAYPRRAIRRAEACRGRARRAGVSREANISGGGCVRADGRRGGGGGGRTHFVFQRCLWCKVFSVLNGYARDLIRKPAEIRHYPMWQPDSFCLCNLQRALRLHRGAQLFETIQTVMIAELLLAAHNKQNGETIKAIHGIYCFTRKAQEAGDQEEKA